jgi:hypothetical protein
MDSHTIKGETMRSEPILLLIKLRLRADIVRMRHLLQHPPQSDVERTYTEMEHLRKDGIVYDQLLLRYIGTLEHSSFNNITLWYCSRCQFAVHYGNGNKNRTHICLDCGNILEQWPITDAIDISIPEEFKELIDAFSHNSSGYYPKLPNIKI